MGCGCGSAKHSSSRTSLASLPVVSLREHLPAAMPDGSGVLRTNATACATCSRRGDCTTSSGVCGVSGRRMILHVSDGSCPRGRHATIAGGGGGDAFIVTRWLGLTWYGLAWPLRLLALLRATSHPRPGRVPVVSVALGRVVLPLMRRGLWPRRLRWMRRAFSSHARLPGCGCSVRLKAMLRDAMRDTWGVAGAGA